MWDMAAKRIFVRQLNGGLKPLSKANIVHSILSVAVIIMELVFERTTKKLFIGLKNPRYKITTEHKPCLVTAIIS